MPDSPHRPLLGPAGTAALRQALDGYTADSVHELIGLAGQAALGRGDLAGVRRAVPAAGELAGLVRLFLLGEPITEAAAQAALHPLPLDEAAGAGLIERSAGSVRAVVDVRPYAEAGSDAEPWWVVSDFGSDVRPGPLATDHVLGVGAASLTLAQATMRGPVGRALDLGTGCGVQALHLSRHAEQVVATDVSRRALRLAATTAALSGADWQLRAGSLTAPVAGEQFDLVVANPPFVVSPGLSALDGGYDYRDSGRAGDGLTRELLATLPDVLAPGGSAQLLANWIIPADGTWSARLEGWLAGSGCDAWIWQREVAELGEYVTLWLRDAGELPGTPRWHERYDRWVDWLADHQVAAVGMGLITLWRPDSRQPGPGRPIFVAEDVPQALVQPIGAEIAGWIARQRWLAATDSDALLGTALRCTRGVVLSTEARRSDRGWSPERQQLGQTLGMRWELDVDESIAAIVAGCDGTRPARVPVAVLAAGLGRPADEVARAAVPVLRDLVARGFLEPVTGLRAVVQRVTQASVSVDGEVVAAVGPGLLVLVGVTHDDTRAVAHTMAAKINGLRILREERALADDPSAALLVVSQFTLYGDARKGRRPTWSAAAPGEIAEPLVTEVVLELRRLGTRVETGVFGADMQVQSVNDGPMTVLLEY